MISSDSTFIKVVGASYSVYTTNKNADVNKPAKLYDYCLSGFDGAFASKCLQDYVPLLVDYVKPLMDYVVDSYFVESLTQFYNGGLGFNYFVQYLAGSISSAENHEMMASEFLKTLATAYGLLSTTMQILPIGIALGLVVAAILYKEQLRQSVEDSKSAQMGLAVIMSVFTAKVAGFFNPTLVNLVYLVVCARRKSVFVTKLTDRLVVEPLYNKLIRPLQKECLAVVEEIEKEKIEGTGNPSLKKRLVSALIGAREKSDFVKSATDPLVKDTANKKLQKKFKSSFGGAPTASDDASKVKDKKVDEQKQNKKSKQVSSDKKDCFSESGSHSISEAQTSNSSEDPKEMPYPESTSSKRKKALPLTPPTKGSQQRPTSEKELDNKSTVEGEGGQIPTISEPLTKKKSSFLSTVTGKLSGKSSKT